MCSIPTVLSFFLAIVWLIGDRRLAGSLPGEVLRSLCHVGETLHKTNILVSRIILLIFSPMKKQNDLHKQFDLGQKCADAKDYAGAIKWWLAADSSFQFIRKWRFQRVCSGQATPKPSVRKLSFLFHYNAFRDMLRWRESFDYARYSKNKLPRHT